MKNKLKIGLITGVALIVVAILIGIITENDIGFVFAGIGTIIIGFSILLFINKNTKNSLPKHIEDENKKNDND